MSQAQQVETPPATVETDFSALVAEEEGPSQDRVSGPDVSQKPPEPTGEVPPSPPVPRGAEQRTMPPVQAPAQPPISEEEIRRKWEERRGQVKEFIRSRYNLTPEQRDSMLTEPEKVLPEMVANLFLDVYDAVFANVAAQVPHIVKQVLDSQQQAQTFDKMLLERWPMLKESQGWEAAVRRIAASYRQLNPNVPLEQAVNDIGAQAIVALGLIDKLTQQPAPPRGARPYAPVAPGAANSGKLQQAEKPANLFQELAEAYLKEFE